METEEHCNRFAFSEIGIVSSPHSEAGRTPIQPCFAEEYEGKVTVFPEFEEGLKDIEGFSHIYLIYAFHMAGQEKLIVKPFLEDVEHGIFATRAPCRPNPLGISIVRLLRRERNVLTVSGVDILDGTPLLDIKPYTAMFDCIHGTVNGWQDRVDKRTAHERGTRKNNGKQS